MSSGRLTLVPDPTLALHPTALALRQLADQIDAQVRAGVPVHDAVEAVPAKPRAAVSAELGYGDGVLALSLQDIAVILRTLDPVIRRAVELLEDERRRANAGPSGGSSGGPSGGTVQHAMHLVDEAITEDAPPVLSTEPRRMPTGVRSALEPVSWAGTLRDITTAPWFGPIALAVAALLGSLVTWLGGEVASEGTEPGPQVENAHQSTPLPEPEPEPVQPRRDFALPVRTPPHAEPEPTP